MTTDSSRRTAHVLNADGTALALIRYHVDPPTLLECRVHQRLDPA